MKGIVQLDCKYANKVSYQFNIKNLGEYHDLLVQCKILLLACAFKNFKDKCIETFKIYMTFMLLLYFKITTKLIMKKSNLNFQTILICY